MNGIEFLVDVMWNLGYLCLFLKKVLVRYYIVGVGDSDFVDYDLCDFFLELNSLFYDVFDKLDYEKWVFYLLKFCVKFVLFCILSIFFYYFFVKESLSINYLGYLVWSRV